jgi:hypothetical protein
VLRVLIKPPETGFNADDGASLLMAFRGLQSESAAQSQVHKSIAHELQTLVAEPFNEWAQDHKVYTFVALASSYAQ